MPRSRLPDTGATSSQPTTSVHLLDRARDRATAEGRQIEFREADAEALPFADGSFDVVLSTFGVMFAPDQEKAAAELVRDLPSGAAGSGWRTGHPTALPASCSGPSVNTVPPPPGVRSAGAQGFGKRINELFNGHGIVSTRRYFDFRYKSAAHWLEVSQIVFWPYQSGVRRTWYAAKQAALQADLVELLGRNEPGWAGHADRAQQVASEIVVTKH